MSRCLCSHLLKLGLLLSGIMGAWSTIASASSASKAPAAAPADCRVVEPDFDYANDIHALDNFGTFARHLLVQQRYDALDCMADEARTNKTKFSGGFWKLHNIYVGLAEPVDGDAHATETDWTDHIERFKRWIAANPKSVTARIALAQVYIGFAWTARGEGYSDTVTENGWRLVDERTRAAAAILKEAYTLPVKCPEWYVATQQLLELHGTNKEQLNALLGQAMALEPTYQYFYRMHANLLAAKWYGEEGDEEKFAQEAADGVGGTQGDILYFQIASHMICPCNDAVDLKLMSWPRMQKGFKDLTDKSGPSLTNLNLLAYMAIKAADPAVADQTFARIGDNWDPTLWKTKSFFEQNKKWASDLAAATAWENSVRKAADADMRTPEGIELKKKFDEKFSARIQKCVASSAPNERGLFVLWIMVGEKGDTRQILANPSSNIAGCVLRQGPEDLLPPPHTPFWLRIEVDPGKMVTASVR